MGQNDKSFIEKSEHLSHQTPPCNALICISCPDSKLAWKMSSLLVLSIILAFSFGFSASSPSNHRYNAGDHVPLFVNKVGPLHNPRYFSVSAQIFHSNAKVLIFSLLSMVWTIKFLFLWYISAILFCIAVRLTGTMTCHFAIQVRISMIHFVFNA